MNDTDTPHGASMRGAHMADPAKPWHKWPTKHVRLRLRVGDHQTTIDVEIVSDAAELGFNAMENAIGEAYQRLGWRDVLPDNDDPIPVPERIAFVELTDANGNRRIVEDTDLRGEEWLKDFVAGIEIVNHREAAQ